MSTAHEVFRTIATLGRPTMPHLRERRPEVTRSLEARMVELRQGGAKIAGIAEELNVAERTVQAVMREHGMCRDQRPEREYLVTVMVPEIVTVRAQSIRQAKAEAARLFNGNARVTSAVELA